MPGPVSDPYVGPDGENSPPQHLTECDGNGTVDCCACGGEGYYSVATDDDPSGDVEYLCDECNGRGHFVCPACHDGAIPDGWDQEAQK